MRGAFREAEERLELTLVTTGTFAIPQCLSEEQVLGFVEGGLRRTELERVDEHVAACAACNALVLEALNVCGARAAARHGGRCVAFEPGALVGQRYVVQRVVGLGGMGDVYEAFDTDVGRAVALKTVRAAACDDRVATRRLLRELELAQRVSHASVYQVYDTGVHEERRPRGREQLRFVTMELIPGEPLTACLQRGPLLVPELYRLGRELLAGLAAIHAADVVHRDIKSHNVMLRADPRPERVVIIDFSLAVDRDDARSSRALEQSSRAGRAAEREYPFEGSPPYMAPEQFRTSAVSPAADVFACGVVLFEALTGASPFASYHGKRRSQGPRRPDELPLSVSELMPLVPRPLEAFIARCLSADPSLRFTDGGDALRAFERLPR